MFVLQRNHLVHEFRHFQVHITSDFSTFLEETNWSCGILVQLTLFQLALDSHHLIFIHGKLPY